MIRTIIAAMFILFIQPAHAALVDLTDQVDLDYPLSGDLTGTVTLTAAGPPGPPVGSYFVNGSLTLNGFPLTEIAIGPTGPGTGRALFADPPSSPFTLVVNLADLPNLTYADFGAQSGTVKIVSEDITPVPLPPALPIFGAALAGLAAFGWLKRRRRA